MIDYNGDRDVDLFVLQVGGGDRLYRNDHGVFREVTSWNGGDHAAWGDYDNASN